MLKVADIYKTYEGTPLLEGVSFSARTGETVCLLGSSGSGKTTLLRIIAGLEAAEKGAVYWGGEDLSATPVHQRHFSLMFQDYALFPHLSVAENIAFGLKMAGMDAKTSASRVKQLLSQMNLEGFEKRRVTELSGGEQQRVALARSLAPNPRLLMLDEPLGALDRALREQLMEELRILLHRSGLPAVYVTHDQREAFSVADRIILLHQGHIVQDGTPNEVYAHPASLWAAHFLGMNNTLPAEVISTRPGLLQTPAVLFHVPDLTVGITPGMQVTVVLRPDAAILNEAEDGEGCFQVRVDDVIYYGDVYSCQFSTVKGQHRLQFLLKKPPQIGAMPWIKINMDGILVYHENNS
jgi:spermidine/putrescine transport system ATP-binding protein